MGIRQSTDALFFGSGVQELYTYWHPLFKGAPDYFQRFGTWETGNAPDAWAYRAQVSDPFDSERVLDKVVTYSVILGAARRIAEGAVSSEKPFHPISPETVQACLPFLQSEDLSQFDPHTVSEVLQVSVYGGIKYPHFKTRGARK